MLGGKRLHWSDITPQPRGMALGARGTHSWFRLERGASLSSRRPSRPGTWTFLACRVPSGVESDGVWDALHVATSGPGRLPYEPRRKGGGDEPATRRCSRRWFLHLHRKQAYAGSIPVGGSASSRRCYRVVSVLVECDAPNHL